MTTPTIVRRAAVAAALALALGIAAAALAQSPRTLGTVEGTLGGEARTWYALDFGGGGDVEPTATVSDYGFGMLQIAVTAHPEQRYSVAGALMIDVSAFGDLDCPCVFDDADVVVWSTSSMFNELYVSDEPGWARVTIASWERVADGIYALEGEVEAELVFLESLGSELDGARTLRLAATFRISEVYEESF